jgi:GNAT superfamily N-acetyltransferase
MEGDNVVGGVLCNARLVERDDAGRIGSMFVSPQYRRRGAGRALMLAAFDAFWQRGVRRIILDTDAGSLTDAPKFYMSWECGSIDANYFTKRRFGQGEKSGD